MTDHPPQLLQMVNLTAPSGIYEHLVKSITDYAIYMLNLDGLVLTWNVGAQLAKGYRDDEIIGRHFSCFYNPADRLARLPQANLECARASGRCEGEGWRLRKDGSSFWAHIVINAVYDASGMIVGFAKITRDCTEERRVREEVRQHERRFRLLVEGITDYAIYLLDANGIVSNWNAGAQRAKGYLAEEIIGQHFSCFYSPADRQAGLPEAGLATALRIGKYEAEGWRFRKDSTRFWAHVVIQPVRDEKGALFGFAKITRDCTAQRLSKLSLLETTRKLDLALANIAQGLCLFDEQGELALSNARFTDLLGLDAGALASGSRVYDLLRKVLRNAPPSSKNELKLIREHLRCCSQPGKEMRHSDLSHSERILSITTRRLEYGGWISTVEDVTTKRHSEQRIEYLARHDAITGLPNRFDFQDRLERMLMSKETSRLALLYLDLDGFKSVNDTLGHHGGDQLLNLVARRLKSAIHSSGDLSRVGGDEFTILMPGCRQVEEAVAVAERCILELSRPFEIAEQEVHIGVSIGVVSPVWPRSSVDLIMQQADTAMYEAKRRGRNGIRVFQSDLYSQPRRRSNLEDELRRALAEQQFQLHYQPIIDSKNGRTNAFEALLRWMHPIRGTVPPAEFIPLAEERNLMPAIGAWVLRRACTDAMAWPRHIRVMVNVSPKQLLYEDFTALLSDVLKTTGLDPGRLELEITETTLIGKSEIPRTILWQVKAMGIGVAMDDFGIGYSSLSLLQEFPFARIKIDRSFVEGLGVNPKSLAIVRSIIALCKSLGMPVIAEGVETEQQRRMLCQEKCRELQGFLFHKPMSPERIPHWLDVLSPALPGRFKSDFDLGTQ